MRLRRSAAFADSTVTQFGRYWLLVDQSYGVMSLRACQPSGIARRNLVSVDINSIEQHVNGRPLGGCGARAGVLHRDRSLAAGRLGDRLWILPVVLAFALLPVLKINQYRFGIGNQAITIPFLKAFVDPSLYPQDYLVEQRHYFITFFWNAVGLVGAYLHVNLTTLFFAIYVLAIASSFLAVYLLSMKLFNRAEVAVLSLFFLSFDKAPLGSRSLFPNYLDTVIVAAPILLFAIYAYTQRRFLTSFALQGIAFLVHPLTAIYAIAFLTICALWQWREIGPRKIVASLLLLLVTASPSLVWKLSATPESLHLLTVDHDWFALLKLRSAAHVFPSTWGIEAVFRGAALVLVFLVSWRHRPSGELHRVVTLATATIVGLWAIGTLFVEFLPVSMVVQLQLFRSSDFLLIFAVLYYANYVYHELFASAPLASKAAAVFLCVGLLYEAARWMNAVLAFAGLAIALVSYQKLVGRPLRPMYFAGSVFLTAILAAGLYNPRLTFSIQNDADPQWLDVQTWARQHTAKSDKFIVPPTLLGFRVGAERTIYGDWKDGTQMFFNPAFGTEWKSRMKSLGYRDDDGSDDAAWLRRFEMLSESDFRDLAARTWGGDERVLLVMFDDRPSLTLPRLYDNGRFTIYEVSPDARARQLDSSV